MSQVMRLFAPLLILALVTGCSSPKGRQPASDISQTVREFRPQAGTSASETDKTLSRLPAEVTINKDAGRGDHLYVTLRLENGRSLRFSVDTGSPITLLDASLEPELGKRLGTLPVGMVGHRPKPAGRYAAPQFHLGDVPLTTGSHVFTYPFKQPAGILGMDCLKHYCMQLDFQAGKIRFLDSDGLAKAELGKAFPMTLVQIGPKGEFVAPVIHHSGLWGADTNLLIDTGCRIDGLTARSAMCQVAWAGFRSWFGSGGLHSCVWDGETYKHIKVAPVGRANVLGLRFLARHLVTLDFPKKTMYLKKTSIGPLSDAGREGQPHPNDPAKGSQPIRSETHSTSSAAASTHTSKFHPCVD